MAISESPSETIGRSGISVADVTVARLSQAMAAGTLTSAELARFYTERIERHNPALGAVISVSADAAEQARAVAVGTEPDGSIVSPAHACGIVGIKPTLGLISRTGIVPISAEQDTAGPMTRVVADAAALLGGLAGADQADETTGQAGGQPADYTRFLDPAALAGARIGVWREGSAQAIAAGAALLGDALGG